MMAVTTSTSAGRPDRAAPAPIRPQLEQHFDVWSRSGSKYRVRAVVLLAVNVLLFAGVGCFAYWIRTGVFFAPAVEGYSDEISQAFNYGQNTSRSLADFLVGAINVQDVPMQIPIVGLLLATLIAIPILVSILYRFWSCVPFVLVVGVLAVTPWLAITLLGSCVLASIRPFRTRFRFMSAVAGLVPTVVYFALAWRGSAEALLGRFDPIAQVKFIAPWVMAIVAATLVFAIVLIIAKLVDYRPGAITPLLAVMFAVPVGLFEFHVGRDELHYRLLERYNAEYFVEEDATGDLKQKAWQRWQRHPVPRPDWDAFLELEQQRWQFELASNPAAEQSALTRHQAELVERCDRFLRRFPTSRYAVNALYIRGRALDMRVDPVAFREEKWIRYYDDFPNSASTDTWRRAKENGSASFVGLVASFKLAQLEARDGEVDRALSKLRDLLTQLDSQPQVRTKSQTPESTERGLLQRARPERSLNIPLGRLLLAARHLHGLLSENEDPLYGYTPICGPRRQDTYPTFGLLDLDPRHPSYVANLNAIKERYPNCQIEDNIDLEIALASDRRHGSSDDTSLAAAPTPKTKLLEACIRRFADRDAAPEALFRLGAAYREANEFELSEEAFNRLAAQHADSIWARQAERYPNRRPRTRPTSFNDG